MEINKAIPKVTKIGIWFGDVFKLIEYERGV